MKLLKFDHQFDGTHMSPQQIMAKARQKGWPGIRIDANEFMQTGVLVIRRLPKRAIR